MKEIDISSCPVIGRGGAGTVYRLDEDKIVKVYHPDMKLESVQRERELARAAIVSGIPSVIPYDTVRCGESYGIVFEMIASDTLGHAFANNPDKTEEYVDRYVAFVKELHSVHLKQDSFEDLKTMLHRAVPGLSDCLGVDELDLLNSLIDSIPDGDSLVHGDLHPGNIMVQDDTLLLIDLDSASRGAKVWELAALFRDLIVGPKNIPQIVEMSMGIPVEMVSDIGHRFFKRYFGIQSEEELQGVFGRLLPIYAFNTILNAAVSGETDGPVYAHIPEMVQEAIIPHEQAIRQGLRELS